ncbi:MAG TPA: nicotinate (nicotinamide) nucleotide adenylyltransferase [Polyangiales bacterium]
MSETIAVYGGSFDPPHVAHTLVVAYVLATQPVDRVLVVPAAEHPFGKRLSTFAHRVRMCELAMQDLRRVEISPIERELPAPSLTLHTLQALSKRHPGAQLRLVIGSDLLAETHAWHNFARIEELAPPIIVERQGHTRSGVDAPALPAVSSTQIRKRLRSGEHVAGLLAPAVAQYALDHALYAG